jgi:leucyl aminopeptidase
MRLELLREFEEAALAGAQPIHCILEKQDRALEALPPTLRALARVNSFSGEAGAVLANDEGVLLGVGDGGDPFVVAAACERLPEGDYYFAAPVEKNLDLICLAWLLGGYRYDRYKKQKASHARLIAPRGAPLGEIFRAADAIGEVRDLVNAPAGDMNPAALEDAARRIGERFGADVESIVGDELLTRNFPMIHAVGRASAFAPRLIDLIWGRADAPKVTLIGKGVCFDSGGLNVKDPAGMLLMKKDMGGAANTLGLAQMIMDAGLDMRLRVLIPAVENAISGSAFRPGDILRSRKGLTVEIGNTDAEGRLVLADAMAYGAEDGPQVLVTLATLTGAARIALGPDLPAFYCDDDAFARDILAASAVASDPVWRMPIWTPYDAMLASIVADINNSASGTFAGSITAALFLKRFAPPEAIWGHFDIYAWRTKASAGRPIGGEAQAIRALFHVFSSRYRR